VDFVATVGGGGANDFEFTLDNLVLDDAAAAAPAPGSLALLGLGLAGLGWARRTASKR
jgi:hypothetical protein